jgi:hypothetical protein
MRSSCSAVVNALVAIERTRTRLGYTNETLAEMSALTCNTAPGATFDTMEEMKAHYKTDWHRYNLKRKVRPPSGTWGGASRVATAEG